MGSFWRLSLLQAKLPAHGGVHSSTLKLVPSDVVSWFMSKAVQLGVMAGGAAVKWCDGDTSKGGEWGQLKGLRCGKRKERRER